MEQDDSNFRFRKKAIAKGEVLVGSRAPNEYLVGILYDDRTPENADIESDFIWLKCSTQTTVSKIQRIYQEKVPLSHNIAIRFLSDIIEPTKTVADFRKSILKLKVKFHRFGKLIIALAPYTI